MLTASGCGCGTWYTVLGVNPGSFPASSAYQGGNTSPDPQGAGELSHRGVDKGLQRNGFFPSTPPLPRSKSHGSPAFFLMQDALLGVKPEMAHQADSPRNTKEYVYRGDTLPNKIA